MSALLRLRQATEIPLCRLEEIPVGLGQAFEVGGRSVAVFRTRKGTIHAVDGTCPHRGAPLADGILAGDRVVCPFHAMRFDLSTGQCDQPGACPVAVHQVRVRDGWVLLTLPEQGQRIAG